MAQDLRVTFRDAQCAPSGAVALQFEALRARATRVINQHINDNGLCAICGSAWPCQRVQLAEHNLALL